MNVTAIADEAEVPDEHDIAADFATETLMGDMRDSILDQVRNMPRPWSAMTEDEQFLVISNAEKTARNTIRQAVDIIAAQGQVTCSGTLEQVTFKNGIKVILTMSAHQEGRHDLSDATGSRVLLVIADASDFMGEEAPAEAEPDEPRLFDTTATGEAVAAEKDAPADAIL